MSESMESRIHKMYVQDCVMAWVDVVLLWASVAFVLVSILGIIQDPNIRLALYVSSGVLVLYNTASVLAMTSHYKEDKEFIYGLDIKHLDANKALAKK
ncbi:MAG: hypothetical protein ACKVN9_05070 [Methylophilaceae bacterium]